MGAKFIIISLCLFLLTNSCTKDETTENNNLTGIWVESELKNDTIKFDSQSNSLWLLRGTEIKNGYDLPKTGSGMYSYEIKNDSIYFHYLLCSAYKTSVAYYFEIDGNNMAIENFYDESLSKSLLSFIKTD